MSDALIEMYVAVFLARCRSLVRAGDTLVEGPGVCGTVEAGEGGRVRLLVFDERALERLASTLSGARHGLVGVFAMAPRCERLVATELSWKRESVVPMVCGDLRVVPELPLPAGLSLAGVRRHQADPAGGVPLDDAVAVVLRAQRDGDEPYPGLADHLRTLPPAFRLFAATDGTGVPRATSGRGVFGTDASVLFVNTDPPWRNRGAGTAMTAAALRDAALVGARRAGLDASDAARSIYARLGFEPLPRLTRFVRTG